MTKQKQLIGALLSEARLYSKDARQARARSTGSFDSAWESFQQARQLRKMAMRHARMVKRTFAGV